MLETTDAADQAANQTVRLDMGTTDGVKSMRIGFTDQRQTAHGGLVAWTRFITEAGLREQWRAVLPHAPTSDNACDPTDTALGFVGGILCGADRLARVAHLAHDPAVAEVLGIEAVPSQSTLSRFFARCGRPACEAISGLHAWSLRSLPERAGGHTLDLDSFSLVHEDGHRQGVRVGYTRKGLKPCHRPTVAAVAEVPLVAHFWLRPGNTACVSGAHDFLGDTLARLPGHVRIGLVRADSGFCTQRMLEVWRRYNGRADIENRIKELGAQFGLKGLCCRSFWATEAACHLAICACNLCVGLQRRLGQTQRAELTTLRWRLFPCAAVFSHAAGKPTLKLAVATAKHRRWWRVLLRQLSGEPACHAVAALAARAGKHQIAAASTA